MNDIVIYVCVLFYLHLAFCVLLLLLFYSSYSEMFIYIDIHSQLNFVNTNLPKRSGFNFLL